MSGKRHIATGLSDEEEDLDYVSSEGNAPSSTPREADSDVISESGLGHSSNRASQEEELHDNVTNPNIVAPSMETSNFDLDHQHREVEEKIEESKEGIASYSIPTETATDNKKEDEQDIAAGLYDKGKAKLEDIFDTDIQKQQQEEIEKATEGIASPSIRAEDSGEHSLTTQAHHSAASELGEPNPTQIGENLGNFLFEVFLTVGDVSLPTLLIPVEQSIDHFPPLANRQENYEEEIKISTPQNQYFDMTLRYNISECAFVMGNYSLAWWLGLIQVHSLKPMDVVRFYRPVKTLYENHYLFDFVNRSQQVARIPEFRPENYLFQAKITAERAMLGQLVLPMQAVRTHFPAVGIPAETHAKERLYFTDAHTSEWIGAIALSGSNTLSYVLTFGVKFGSSYHLKADDAIRFYRPVQPLNSRHFLIEIQERGAARTDPSQSGSAENDGDGDDSGQGVGKRDGGTRRGGNKRGGGHGVGGKVRRFGCHFLCGTKKDYHQDRAILSMQLGSSGDLIKEEEEKIVIKGI